MTPIDLKRFAKVETAILPLIDGWGSYNGRKFYFNKVGETLGTHPEVEDGFYEIEISDYPKIIKKASPLEIRKAIEKLPIIRGYPIGEELIPVNFDNFIRKGWENTIRVYFMNARPFHIAECVQWECGRFFYKRLTILGSGNVFKKIGERFENEQRITDLSGVTPEMSYYFLVLNLQRQSVREVAELEKFKLDQVEKAKRVAEFQATFSGRLSKTIENAGGKLVKWMKHGKGYLIHWKIKGNEQIIKSIIRDDFGVISGGYCLSSHDKAHSMSSIIQLAKIYTQEDSLNITRL